MVGIPLNWELILSGHGRMVLVQVPTFNLGGRTYELQDRMAQTIHSGALADRVDPSAVKEGTRSSSFPVTMTALPWLRSLNNLADGEIASGLINLIGRHPLLGREPERSEDRTEACRPKADLSGSSRSGWMTLSRAVLGFG